MKRSFIIIVSLVLALGLVTVAGAEDRLTINGDYYLRAIYIDNPVFGGAAGSPGEPVEYFTQRLRTDMKMALSEEMALQLRADWAENDWGSKFQHPTFTDPDISKDANAPGNGLSVRNVLQIEYANVKINKPMWGLSVGLQDPIIGYGMGDVYRPHGYGIGVKLNLPVTVNLDLFKNSEGGTTDNTSNFRNDNQAGNDDINWYSLQASGKAGKFTIGGFYANLHNLEAETMKHALEIWTRGQAGPVSISGAVDYLFGQQTKDIDYAGTISAMVDAGISITPALRLGGHLYYTSPGDEDNGEVNLPNLTVWGPSVNFVAFGMPGVTFDGAGYEIGFQNRNIILGQGNAGQMAADVYASFKVLPVLTLAGQVLYAMPADDDLISTGGPNAGIDSKLGISAGVSYNYKPNVIISLAGCYSINSYDSDKVSTEPDDPFGVQANFWVLF